MQLVLRSRQEKVENMLADLLAPRGVLPVRALHLALPHELVELGRNGEYGAVLAEVAQQLGGDLGQGPRPQRLPGQVTGVCWPGSSWIQGHHLVHEQYFPYSKEARLHSGAGWVAHIDAQRVLHELAELGQQLGKAAPVELCQGHIIAQALHHGFQLLQVGLILRR